MRLAALLLCCCIGCAGNPPPEPQATSVCLNANLRFSRVLWEWEASRRFSKPICIIVHGNTYNETWYAYPDFGPPLPVESLARLMHEVFRDKPLVLICCNPDGNIIHVEDVWFARKDVWTIPDFFAPTQRLSNQAVGSISDFQQ